MSQWEDVTGLPAGSYPGSSGSSRWLQQLSCHSCRNTSLRLSCSIPGTVAHFDLKMYDLFFDHWHISDHDAIPIEKYRIYLLSWTHAESSCQKKERDGGGAMESSLGKGLESAGMLCALLPGPLSPSSCLPYCSFAGTLQRIVFIPTQFVFMIHFHI